GRGDKVPAHAGHRSLDTALAPRLAENPPRLAPVADEIVGPLQPKVRHPAHEDLRERHADGEREARQRRITAADPALERDRERECRTRLGDRSEEHTSELQSRENLVCRLLLEEKNNEV